MSQEDHRTGICRKVHQEASEQIESAWSVQGGHREGSEHPEANPASQCHHSARCVRKQERGHPHSRAVSIRHFFHD